MITAPQSGHAVHQRLPLVAVPTPLGAWPHSGCPRLASRAGSCGALLRRGERHRRYRGAPRVAVVDRRISFDETPIVLSRQLARRINCLFLRPISKARFGVHPDAIIISPLNPPIAALAADAIFIGVPCAEVAFLAVYIGTHFLILSGGIALRYRYNTKLFRVRQEANEIISLLSDE